MVTINDYKITLAEARLRFDALEGHGSFKKMLKCKISEHESHLSFLNIEDKNESSEYLAVQMLIKSIKNVYTEEFGFDF